MLSDELANRRFQLVTLAHRFVLNALPLRPVASRAFLDSFISEARTYTLPAPDLEAVLLKILSIVNPYTGGRLPSLVDRFLSERRPDGTQWDAFRAVVTDVIRFRGIGDPEVQTAIASLERNYADSTWTEQQAAAELGLFAQELCTRFRRATGSTWTAYRRDIRLDRAAGRLLTTGERVKTIWSTVGYNDASTFCHDFHARFGVSPKEYRLKAIATPTKSHTSTAASPPTRGAPSPAILLVDDDATGLTTLSRFLSTRHFVVLEASTGTQALDIVRGRSDIVALIDYHLPDMTGLDLLAHIRQQSCVPAAIFSADWAVEERRPDILTLQGLYVPKLCDPEEICSLTLSLCSMLTEFQDGAFSPPRREPSA